MFSGKYSHHPDDNVFIQPHIDLKVITLNERRILLSSKMRTTILSSNKVITPNVK
jgi:hypothetical protein